MNRRHFLQTSALSLPVVALATATTAATPALPKPGLSIASYMLRWGQRDANSSPGPDNWKDALNVLDHCDQHGIGCLQIGVANWTADFAGKVRDRREALNISLEGQIRLPFQENGLPKFEAELAAAKEAGASIVRTVCLSGRRYEKFESHEQWKKFVFDSRAALERVDPVLARHGVKLAFENHKDWRVDEQLDLLKHLSSEHIGVTFDFGNNLALLEDPHHVAEDLAPYILSTHMKDMAMAPCANGFLLSEVPLGAGMLDLPRIIKTCTDANPNVQFNLEMITRDPLTVPVLEAKYWQTMARIPAPDLASTLKQSATGTADSLPVMAGKSPTAQLAFEEQNVADSIRFAKSDLGFA